MDEPKMKKFPKIISYLKAYRPDVYEIFDQLGMQGDLNPRRGGSITFLCPDQALTQQIMDVLNGSTPEDATDMLAALILTDLYNSPSEMIDAVVRTHSGKQLAVKRIGSTDITLANGAKILPKIDPPFVPFERKATAKRDNMAIWQYVGSMWDYNSAQDVTEATKQPKTEAPKRVTGQSTVGLGKQFVKNVTMAAVAYYAENSKQYVVKDGVNNPFIRATACVLSNLRNDMPSLCRVMPFIFTPNRAVMFYSLVHLVDERIFANCSGWQNLRSPYDVNLIYDCMEAWMQFTETAEPRPALSTLAGQQKFYTELHKFIETTPKSKFIHKREQQTVESLINNNAFGKTTNVLPTISADAVKAHPYLFKLVNVASYDITQHLDNVTGCRSKSKVDAVLKELIRFFSGSKESMAARIEGQESYDNMANEFENADWLHVKRTRFRTNLLSSLPMHRDVASTIAPLFHEVEKPDVVALKVESANIVGNDDIDLSEASRVEMREYLRRAHALPDEFQKILAAEESRKAKARAAAAAATANGTKNPM